MIFLFICSGFFSFSFTRAALSLSLAPITTPRPEEGPRHTSS